MQLMTLIVFIISVAAMLAIDFYAHRKGGVITLKGATIWSLFYVACAMGFAVWVYFSLGADSASKFLTGYAIEKVLAFDNLFVFSLIFTYFNIDSNDRHKALYWGIAGAIVFRLIFVIIGTTALDQIGPVVEIVFAVLILLSVILILKAGDDEDVDYDKTWYVRGVRKIFPQASVLFVAICVIEISDILFSFDSVPAIIAITKDPLLIYSAMMFAILGLRSMYFIIAALEGLFIHMDKAVVLVLLFISFKLLAGPIFDFHIGSVNSLLIIITFLIGGGLASIALPENKHE